jgi:hypothetical protein
MPEITFEENLTVLNEKMDGDNKMYKIRAMAARINSDTGSRVTANQVEWITAGDNEIAQLVAFRKKLGDEIKVNMQDVIAREAKLNEIETNFHNYLTAREDIQ